MATDDLAPLAVHERRAPDPYGHTRFLELLVARLEDAARPHSIEAALHEDRYTRARRRGLLEAAAIARTVAGALTEIVHKELQEGARP